VITSVPFVSAAWTILPGSTSRNPTRPEIGEVIWEIETPGLRWWYWFGSGCGCFLAVLENQKAGDAGNQKQRDHESQAASSLAGLWRRGG